jgi:hypothetical protein
MSEPQETGIELRSPSEAFPPRPAFSVVVPATWRPEPTTDAALLAYDEASPAHFRTNVLVTVERVRADAQLTDAVRHFATEAASAYADYRVLSARNAPVGGLPAALRLHSFTPPSAAAAVFQLQVLLLVPPAGGGPTADLVALHATCSAEQAARYAPAFEAMVDSFRLLAS